MDYLDHTDNESNISHRPSSVETPSEQDLRGIGRNVDCRSHFVEEGRPLYDLLGVSLALA